MTELAQILPRLGHRNWIAVVDAAYPDMVAPGITSIGGGDAESVLATLARQPHVRPEAFLDAELAHLTEDDAPGVEAYRAWLDALLAGIPVTRLPHEEILALVDAAARTFRVVVVKTALPIPYSSLFLRLECGYWSLEAESRLRSRLALSPHRTMDPSTDRPKAGAAA